MAELSGGMIRMSGGGDNSDWSIALDNCLWNPIIIAQQHA
jgi:hypothetical protein